MAVATTREDIRTTLLGVTYGSLLKLKRTTSIPRKLKAVLLEPRRVTAWEVSNLNLAAALVGNFKIVAVVRTEHTDLDVSLHHT